MKKKKKPQKWTKFRHKVVRNILFGTLGVYTRLRYNVKIEKFKEQNGRQYLVLFNHQTAYDQFLIGMSFKGPLYYVASEDIFTLGFASRLIKYLVAPIPIKKQANDARAVINCMKVAKEGGSIALAPEGNRTYSGKTEYINPSIVGLVKALKLPLALCRIEGGYGVHPRWSDKIRRGKMRSYVSRVVEYEEYSALSDEQIYALICKELYVNEAVDVATFTGKALAEYVERAIYVCPKCGFSTFESHGDVFECKKCGIGARYLPTGRLEPLGAELPFEFINDWYEYQNAFVNEFDSLSDTGTPLYTERANVSLVIPGEKKQPLYQAEISLYGDRIEMKPDSEGVTVFRFDEIKFVTVLGKNKFDVYTADKIYQFKSDERFCALKYVNLFYRYINVKENNESKFLGL
jgi:1-acyl-sn-glycerol-3-phosphate acyltransferase